MISDLNGLLGSQQFFNVTNERTCFAPCACAFQTSRLITRLECTLTKKLPLFLSRLNEINGGCEKILPLSGSFWSNLKIFRMMDFAAWFWGWMVLNYYSPSETFVVLTADQFVGGDDGLLEQQRRDCHVCRKKSLISSDSKEKSKSSLQRRRSLWNWE